MAFYTDEKGRMSMRCEGGYPAYRHGDGRTIHSRTGIPCGCRPDKPDLPADTLADALREDQEERDGERPANDHYTGKPCVNCGRIRVYLRRNGTHICEKCEVVQ